ncbi:unnamed protein product [Heligmosomoides polygyrus]|uniref:WD_REPEATS_REGION domain-containing protein n=1 Tax=Heligmosomoides polygyrus TaxID=6339 RepID=A0A183FZ02_HELPZ|nr:unnamed protein product [Heligmosomoides polygyrus]
MGAGTDWIPRDVNRTPGRPLTRWSDFFVKPRTTDMTFFASLERAGSIGSFWHATETNGDVAGARSSHSMINATTGDGVKKLWEHNNVVVMMVLSRLLSKEAKGSSFATEVSPPPKQSMRKKLVT